MDPKWLFVTVVAWKGCRDWPCRSCSTPLGITCGCHCVNQLCAFVCKIGYVDAQIRKIVHVGGLTYLPLCKNLTNQFCCINSWNNLHTRQFLYSILNTITQIPSHSFWLNQLNFTIFIFILYSKFVSDETCYQVDEPCGSWVCVYRPGCTVRKNGPVSPVRVS